MWGVGGWLAVPCACHDNKRQEDSDIQSMCATHANKYPASSSAATIAQTSEKQF